MRFIDGFRNPLAASAFRDAIAKKGTFLCDKGQTIKIMEVCGSHTMAIARFGIRDALPDCVDLISGPGCPVCVTPPGYIDAAVMLAEKGFIIASFGDMINVQGSETSLAGVRAAGADVQVCYSPARAIELAREHPENQVVFMGIGFETTIGPVISIIKESISAGITNLSLLTSFKLIPPALEVLLLDPELRIDAFLCPAHVSAIIGWQAYEPLVNRFSKSCIVAGFEPLDILMAIDRIMELIVIEKTSCENHYSRVVTAKGNLIAQKLMDEMLEPCDPVWRGMGIIPGSGLRLKPEYSQFDAEKKFGFNIHPGKEREGCLCGNVIKGSSKPDECAFFGKACTPLSPIGPCMVSSEGTCAAYYKYLRVKL